MNRIFYFVVFFLFIGVTTSFSQKDIDVFVFVSEECPVCIYMSKNLNQLQEKYGEKVNFTLVFSQKNSTYKTIHLFKQKYHLLDYKSKLDSDQSFAKKMGASVTPEVFVLDRLGVKYYQGRVDNSYYAQGKIKRSGYINDLDQALDLALQNKKTPLPWGAPIGCYITFF